MSRALAAARQAPLRSALAGIALASTLYVVVYPLFSVRYPAMTDLPFHAAHASTLRHYWDPAWHFREQFELTPLAVPYLSMYAIAAVLMLVFPMITAVKLAAALMLALLPIGLAVMFWGMKKSPLLGLSGLGLVWCNLTHWGFLNFVGALGVFAMVIGLTLKLLDAPTRTRSILLAVALVFLFFTHIFRFPFAVAVVLGSAIVMAPATRSFRPVLLPLVPSLVLFAIWLVVRPSSLGGDFGSFAPHLERLGEIPSVLYGSFEDPGEAAAVRWWLIVLALVAVVSAWFGVGRLGKRGPKAGWAWTIGANAVPLCSALVFLWLFLALPMQIGDWWYVYPREATAAALLALGVLPDLPTQPWLRLACVLALGMGPMRLAAVVARNEAVFDRSTRDFDAIVEEIPQAPKLLYLIFDHTGSTRTTTPFIHLPAYVQATRGGWLSFHFAVWKASPLQYRAKNSPGSVVPPDVPTRWEWSPQLFRVNRHGAFFDWFLVRQRSSPDALFRNDPAIERVDHRGTWWLYHRKSSP